MPKLSSRTSTWQASPDAAGETIELHLEGFIDAANFEAFERILEAASEAGRRFLILDFGAVHYINSTGISALIRHFELYRSRGGLLLLANVAKPVGLSMHLLGLTSFVPFLKDVPAARAHVQDFLAGKTAPPTPPPPHDETTEGMDPATPADLSPRPPGRGRVAIPLRRRRIPGLEKARVLVITPAKNRFTRVLRLRFNSLNGDYHLLHDTRQAMERYEEMDPDLIVIDDRCDPKGEFVSRVKIQSERSLTSIIKIYGKQSESPTDVDFKIWENDYLVEPFEVLELFSLAEAELTRVPKDRKVFQQQVHFELKTMPENVEKACKLSDLILRQAIRNHEDATALYAGVKEGIDNAVRHGNRESSKKSIDINFLVDQKKVTVIIEDQGEGFDYEYYLSRIQDGEAFEKAKRRILEEGLRGGLGILLMSKCADRIEYSGGGNTLRLEKNIG